MFKNFFFSICKKTTNNYYQKQKENLQKEARQRYQNLSKEEKDKEKTRKGPRKISKSF